MSKKNKICRYCQKIFYKPLKHPERWDARIFCSPKCSGLGSKTQFEFGHKKLNNAGFVFGHKIRHNNHLSGGNHYNWRGGITSLNDKLRKSKKIKIWKKRVFERDGYICQECGQRGGKLHIHHIKPFSLFPKLRFDVDNGLTLCTTCHYKTNTYAGNIRKYNMWGWCEDTAYRRKT
jgi:hypothetical protein